MNHLDQSPAAHRERAMHAQRMMQLRSNGDGFRRIPEHSNQVSLVERHLIAAGDMSPPPSVPDDRSYRRARREKDARHQRLDRVARKEEAKLVPTKHRSQDLEPNDQLVDQVLDAYKGIKNPAKLVFALVSRMGYGSIAAYDAAAARAERYLSKVRDGRIPNHVRDKIVLKRMVERCLEKRFGTQQVTA